MIFPHSQEAEKAVLGSMILHESNIYEGISSLHADDFYIYFNKRVFEIIIKLYKQNIAIDIVTICNESQKEKEDFKPDVMAKLKDILNSVATSAHFKYYLDILKEKSNLRKLLVLSSKIQQDCEINQKYDDIVFEINNVLKNNVNLEDIKDINEISDDVLAYYEERTDNKVTDLLTGINPIDEIFGGYAKGSLNVIAANTGVGKSTLAINIAENVARSGKNILIFSMEMEAIDVVHKMISATADLSYWSLKKAFLNKEKHEQYVNNLEIIRKLNIAICDRGLLNIDKITAMIKTAHIKKPLDLIVIDYLQLIKSDNYKQNKSLQIGEITQTLKAIARDLKTHIILISQFSRENSKQNRPPILADLKESSSIEQDADNVLFIHYNENENNHQIICAKNRHGQTGKSDIIFDGSFSIFK